MADAAHESPAWRKRVAPFVLVAATLLLAAIIVNPFREMCTLDDSFSYARMVQHLLATGRYQLDAWAAANMPVQIYLAAGLSKIFGYSLSLLRCTTLCLFVLGLTSFYLLLRELGQARDSATILTLAIAANPIVLMLAFTFMSDVQFLGWLLLALLLYVRGIRRQNAWTVFFASLAAGCAIGTRQFGAVLLVALFLSWLLPSRNRPPARLLIVGAVVPLIAMLAQIYFGLRAPNLTQTLRIHETQQYLGSPAKVLVKEAFWRCVVITQYTGMALLPLLPFALAEPRSFWTKRIARVPLWILTLLALALILIGLSKTSPITARPEVRSRGLREPLEMYWLLPSKLWPIPSAMWFLDICGIAGGTFLIAIGLFRLQTMRRARLSPETLFLAGTGFGLLLLHLVYRQLNDTYIVALIPFGLLLFGLSPRNLFDHPTVMRVSAGLSIILVLFTALWMRGEYALQEAIWNSADQLLRPGIQPLDIAAPCWADYHGSFDAWIAAGAPGFYGNPKGYIDPLHDAYHAWLQQQWDHGLYRVQVSPTISAPLGWQIVAVRSFRSHGFTRMYVLSLARTSESPQPSTESTQKGRPGAVKSSMGVRSSTREPILLRAHSS